jgi:HNH endonuclease
MTLSTDLMEQVRRRAHFACEYCGVTETDVGGQLTVDHFQPQARGGTDGLENLLYCCHRCNLYKADYWPTKPNDPVFWNPRWEPSGIHLLLLADGTLYPITSSGALTLRRLRLNRSPLVAHRLRRQAQTEELRLLARYRELVTLLEQLHRQQTALLEEHHALLEEQRKVLRVLLKISE